MAGTRFGETSGGAGLQQTRPSTVQAASRALICWAVGTGSAVHRSWLPLPLGASPGDPALGGPDVWPSVLTASWVVQTPKQVQTPRVVVH
jgi:hypothetical protein